MERHIERYESECLSPLLQEEPEKPDELNEDDNDDGDAPQQPPTSGDTPEADTPSASASEDLSATRFGFGDPDAVETVLLKPIEDVTEAEIRRASGTDAYWRAGDADFNALREKVGSWYQHVYGTDTVTRDGTGRQVAAAPKNPPPSAPKPLRTVDGETLETATRALSNAVSGLAKRIGGGPAVRRLQQGLNIAAKPSTAPLKEDGILGPKTKRATRKDLAERGAARTEEAIALGGLSDAAKRTGDVKTLKKAVEEDVAPLFGAEPEDGVRHATRALQFGINESGPDDPLKEDGVLGPKTAAAFDGLSCREGPVGAARKIGLGVGWLD